MHVEAANGAPHARVPDAHAEIFGGRGKGVAVVGPGAGEADVFRGVQFAQDLAGARVADEGAGEVADEQAQAAVGGGGAAVDDDGVGEGVAEHGGFVGELVSDGVGCAVDCDYSLIDVVAG